jgi:hypothetical protein
MNWKVHISHAYMEANEYVGVLANIARKMDEYFNVCSSRVRHCGTNNVL